MLKENKSTRMPVVGVPTDRHRIGELNYDCTQHKYLDALYQSAKVLPMQIPLFGHDLDVDAILNNIDGMMLTGSHSNVHPEHYGDVKNKPDFLLDRDRDATILPLIKPAVKRGIPLFAICRGFQELNVAYGGTLNPRLADNSSSIMHGEDKDLPLAQRYGDVHSVKLTVGGLLHQLLGVDVIDVNSLHDQGIDTPGDDLVIDGQSDDGVIEVVTIKNSKGFALGVQWHPEWRSTDNPISTAIFEAFGRACYLYAES